MMITSKDDTTHSKT